MLWEQAVSVSPVGYAPNNMQTARGVMREGVEGGREGREHEGVNLAPHHAPTHTGHVSPSGEGHVMEHL